MRTLRQDYVSIPLFSGCSILRRILALAAIWICPLAIGNCRRRPGRSRNVTAYRAGPLLIRLYGGISDRSSGCLCRSRKECSAHAQYAPKLAPLCCIEPGQAEVGLFTARELLTLVRVSARSVAESCLTIRSLLRSAAPACARAGQPPQQPACHDPPAATRRLRRLRGSHPAPRDPPVMTATAIDAKAVAAYGPHLRTRPRSRQEFNVWRERDEEEGAGAREKWSFELIL